jgi:hypothetical protein
MSDPIENGSNRDNKGQFVAGNTASVGNGRPKGTQSIPDILRKIGEEEGTVDGKSKLDVIMYMVFKFALEGRPWAVQFIADRTEGKAVEHIDQTLKHEPIRVFDFDD